MKFTIDRSRWRCGFDGHSHHGDGDPMLLNAEGFRCCLGFVCEQLGVADISNISAPRDMAPVEEGSPLIGILLAQQGLGSDLAEEAEGINDCTVRSDQKREFDLRTIFAEYGHEIEFIGEFQD